MSSNQITRNFNLFYRVIIIALVSTLFTSLLTPVIAKAAPTNTAVKQTKTSALASYPKLDSAPVLVEAKTSHGDLGDSAEPQIITEIDQKLFETLPPFAFRLYNLDTGKLQDKRHTGFNKPSLDINKFANQGVNRYVVVLTTDLWSDAKNLNDLDNVIARSEVIEFMRKKPITIKLWTEKWSDGRLYDSYYSLNQHMNGDDYAVQMFNMTTNTRASDSLNWWGTTKEERLDYIDFHQPGKDHNFIAVLRPLDKSCGSHCYEEGWEETYRNKKYSDVNDSAASSNVVNVQRAAWSVSVKQAKTWWGSPTGYLHADTKNGQGRYSTYLVDDATGEIIWISNKLGYTNPDSIPNPHNPNVDWATAYIAFDYEWFNWPKPTHVSDLKHVIADSRDLKDLPSGVSSNKELAGGNNPNEICNVRCVGDPVNNATGEFFDKKTDISSVGSGLIPKVDRAFSTINKDVNNSLGNGWRNNYEMKISSGGDIDSEEYDSNILTSKIIQIENENGSITPFFKSSDGSYSSKTNTQASLKFDQVSQTFKFERMKTKETFTFDPSGKLLKIENNKNQKVTLTYNNYDRVSVVSDLIGNSLTFAYNDENLLTSVTSQNNEKSLYTYNDKKQLVSVKNDKNVEYFYTYDEYNRIITLTNELGGKTTNTYDNQWNNRIIKQVDPLNRTITFEYTKNQYALTEMSETSTEINYPNGKVVKEIYNNGQLVKSVENFGKENALTSYFSYDSGGNLVSTANPDGSYVNGQFDSRDNQIEFMDSSNERTYFEYDDRDNLIKVTDPFGNETTNTYDDRDNLISTTTPLGEKTTFTYDSNSLLTSVTDARGNETDANPADFTSTLKYLPNRLLESSKDALNGVTEAEYDNLGRLKSTTDALGNKSKIAYNDLGLPSKITDPLQNETAMTYDQMGNVLTSKNAQNAVSSYTYDNVGNMLKATNALGEITSYEYDQLNNPIKITLHDGSFQSIKYDIFDRPIEITDQLGNVTKQVWDDGSKLIESIDAEGKKTEYEYDRNGNLWTVTNPVGAVTTYEYDKLDRVISITDSLGRITKTVYNANGRVIENIAADNTSVKTEYDSVGNIIKTTDENGKSKLYTYDALNRQISYTNETGQVTEYTYDANSNLISQTRPDESVVIYEYDARNLLKKIDYPGLSEDIFYVYDSLGRKTSETKGSKEPTFYTYDALNRIKSQGKQDEEVSYTYDNVGNLTKLTYPSGRVVDYSYDSGSQMNGLDTSGINDAVFEYNKRGQEIKAILPNGVTESKSYDSAGRLIGSELKNPSDASIYKRTQKYNSANEVTQKGVYSNGETISLDNFLYDPTSKLTSQKDDSNGNSVNSYSYNNVGNLGSINADSQSHDDAGKIISSGNKTINYDERNNRISVVDSIDSSKNEEYVWAQDNLLKEITTHDDSVSTLTKYEYGADSLLEKRTEGAKTDKFVWDTNRTIPVMLSDGKFEYIYKSDDRTPFAQVEIATDEVTYLHNDLTGSVVATTSSNGELIGKVDYSPYGETTDEALSSFGYAGEWTDETTGLSYLRARWLDVSTGSFLSEDPLIQLTQNAFGYSEGNPLTQIDPLGLFSLGGLIKGTGEFILDHSTEISVGLFAAGAVISATGFGAPLGIPIAIAGSVISGASALNNLDKGNYADAALDAAGMIPGLGILKPTKNINNLKKSIKATKNVDYKYKGQRQKQNRQNGKIENHNAIISENIKKNKDFIYNMDAYGAWITGLGVVRKTDSIRKKKKYECI